MATEVRFVLGTGKGDLFDESGPDDGLYFITKPAPSELTGKFPSFIADPSSQPDNLLWSGLQNDEETASFWVGIRVPQEIGGTLAIPSVFTLRQEIIVPEPSTLALCLLSLACGMTCRRVTSRRAVSGSSISDR